MGKIKTWLQQLRCPHSFHLNRWHWCHGPNGNDPIMIEYECLCPQCGKLVYGIVKDQLKDTFADVYKDKEWR